MGELRSRLIERFFGESAPRHILNGTDVYQAILIRSSSVGDQMQMLDGIVLHYESMLVFEMAFAPASPKWRFDDATFDRSARAFDNPDHVSVVIHNYRWRLGLAEGESKYDDLERQLAAGPVITVPTITREGDAHGAPHPDPASYAKRFSSKYAHRLLTGGVGHNPPQEAPKAFADAVIAADQL